MAIILTGLFAPTWANAQVRDELTQIQELINGLPQEEARICSAAKNRRSECEQGYEQLIASARLLRQQKIDLAAADKVNDTKRVREILLAIIETSKQGKIVAGRLMRGFSSPAPTTTQTTGAETR